MLCCQVQDYPQVQEFPQVEDCNVHVLCPSSGISSGTEMSCSGVFSGSVVVLFSVSLVTRSGRKSSSSMCKREFFRNREFSGKIDFNNYFLS